MGPWTETLDRFDVVDDSAWNADLGIELIGSILASAECSTSPKARGNGPARSGGSVTSGSSTVSWLPPMRGRAGWSRTSTGRPASLAPMAIMGKYYMHYGSDFLPPRELGRACAERLRKELAMDDAGLCRFHRAWGERMMPEAIGLVYGKKEGYLEAISVAASRINSRNAAVFWESEADIELVRSFLVRRRDVEKDTNPELARWIAAFEADPKEASIDFWFEMRKGIDESLRDFF